MTTPTLDDLDSVGSKRSELLRQAGFESVDKLIGASMADLTAIDGIGESTATDIITSATVVLDESEPAAAVEPSATAHTLSTENRIDAQTYVAEPYRGFEVEPTREVVDVTIEPDREDATRTDREKPVKTESGRTEAGTDRRKRSAGSRDASAAVDDGRLVSLASDLLDASTDEDGRIGWEPLRASDFDANVRLGIAPAGTFDMSRTTALSDMGYDDERIERVAAMEQALRSWVADEPDRGARLLTDRTGALADAAAAADQPINPSVVADSFGGRATESGLLGVGLQTLTVELSKGSR